MEYARKIVLLKNLLEELQLETSKITVEETFINENGKKETRSYVVNKDEGPRAGTSVEALSGLRPVFAADGSVTAGNSSQMSDGAAFVLIMSEEMSLVFQECESDQEIKDIYNFISKNYNST